MKRILIYLLLATQIMAGMADQVLRNTYSNKTLRTSAVDGAGRQGLNSIFGESLVGTRRPQIAVSFSYGYRERRSNTVELNGGTVSVEDNMLTGQTSTATNGAVSIETKDYVRYIAGYDTFAMWTTIFDEPKVDSNQRIGLFDEGAGYFIGYEDDGEFYFTHRSSGVDEHISLDFDKLSFDIDLTKGNVWRLTYGYLGFAPVILEILNPQSKWELLHIIENPNNYVKPHISNTYLPIRGEVANSGNDTNIKMQSASVAAGIVDGVGVDLAREYRHYNNGEVNITAGDTVLVTFRNKTTFNSKPNKIAAKLNKVLVASEINKGCILHVEKSATITNSPTYTNIGSGDSIVEYTTGAVVTYGSGFELISPPISKEDSFGNDYSHDDFLLYPGETVTFWVETSGTGDFILSTSWFELF